MNINFLAAEDKDLDGFTSSMLGGNAQLLENIHFTLQHLTPSQMKELCEFLNSYKIIFRYQPGQCKILNKDIELFHNTTSI